LHLGGRPRRRYLVTSGPVAVGRNMASIRGRNTETKMEEAARLLNRVRNGARSNGV